MAPATGQYYKHNERATVGGADENIRNRNKQTPSAITHHKPASVIINDENNYAKLKFRR